jgi:hypothetical protein
VKWFHRHRWKIVSVSCDGFYHLLDVGGFTPYMHVKITHVVRVCDCGELRHDDIPGDHKIEALQGENPEIAEILKKIR